MTCDPVMELIWIARLGVWMLGVAVGAAGVCIFRDLLLAMLMRYYTRLLLPGKTIWKPTHYKV